MLLYSLMLKDYFVFKKASKVKQCKNTILIKIKQNNPKSEKEGNHVKKSI